MDVPARFFAVIKQYSLQNAPVLVAVSGGLDSVVLCELCHRAGMAFSMAHCHFGLRGAESDRDLEFVENLSKKYKVPFFGVRFDTTAYAQEKRLSVQEAARDLRYAWFNTLRTENGFACTLLAHHANDNVETVLMNFFRGTGLEGLTGMPQYNNEKHVLRPLLQIRRAGLEVFAHEANLAWVEDSSNSESKYTRNFFRNELMPQVQKIYPNVTGNLLQNINRLQQAENLYKDAMAALLKRLCLVKGEEVHIPVARLMQYSHTPLLWEILRSYGFGEKAVPELVKLSEAESGKWMASATHRIIRNRKWFVVAPLAVEASLQVVEKDTEAVVFGSHVLLLKEVAAEKFVLQKKDSIAQLDAAKIDFPLVLRRWKTGDYFYPLGMSKKKKLARFFIDQKLSKTEKENAWVLESHKRIVWVVGYRIDDRFKVNDNTRSVLLLTQKHQVVSS